MRKLVQVGARDIVIFNIKGELFALSDKCPHKGGSLSKGKLTGLVKSSEPGEYAYSRPGEMIRCSGTTGSSTSARDAPGAIPSACG